MEVIRNMTTTFHDFTVSDTTTDCNQHDLYSTTEFGETKFFMEKELVIAAMVNNLRYYIEGVILTPVATIGLFGKLISNRIFSYLSEWNITN
jgi:hypothetical protein